MLSYKVNCKMGGCLVVNVGGGGWGGGGGVELTIVRYNLYSLQTDIRKENVGQCSTCVV